MQGDATCRTQRQQQFHSASETLSGLFKKRTMNALLLSLLCKYLRIHFIACNITARVVPRLRLSVVDITLEVNSSRQLLSNTSNSALVITRRLPCGFRTLRKGLSIQKKLFNKRRDTPVHFRRGVCVELLDICHLMTLIERHITDNNVDYVIPQGKRWKTIVLVIP